MARSQFTFVDLFAGIGGFHAALSALGGKCVYAVEIDKEAASIYARNWGMNPFGDITVDANDKTMNVPEHDVLCAGFPCQPFSKSGAQRGMDETRGTLYWNILRIIQERRPSVVLLENVRNLAGPRHLHEWQVIIETLRDEGYIVSETPSIFSPHLLPPERGGRPQHRERVFITASRSIDPHNVYSWVDPPVTNRAVGGWDPKAWHLESDLPLEPDHDVDECELTADERIWIEAWDDFVKIIKRRRGERRLPGFPIWVDAWVDRSALKKRELAKHPEWKANILIKNSEFYSAYRRDLDRWLKKWKVLSTFPASRRKFEWQAQDTESLWDTVLHLRPSGIRAKAPTYLPALVAITQTSIVGSRERRLSPREATRLQGLPESFDFGNQRRSATYRQLGNCVSVGAVWHVLREHVLRDEEIIKTSCPKLLRAVQVSPTNPDTILDPTRSQLAWVVRD
jgi:DNA (cytosine-5)-methyltransferase 1